MQNYIGQQIDRYRIIERLGMGGMAVVYKAYDVRLEREVALKLIRTEEIPASQHERLIKRFEREAKAQARFNHRHIVPVHDYGVVDGSPYLVMAYVEGGTLKDRINGLVGYQRALDWLLPIADALAYAHLRGIVHRDVKPSNILFDEAGQPLLTDFGIAKILETDETTLTGAGLGVGTPEYMAPEQWQGKAVAATDQYALGVVLYELLTGQKPYSAETPVAIALKQMNDPLPRPSELVSGIPDALEKILFKAMAKDPGDRYTHMAAFANALMAVPVGKAESPEQPFIPDRQPAEPIPAMASEGETVDAFEMPVTPGRQSRKTEKQKKKGLPKKVLWSGIGFVVLLMVVGSIFFGAEFFGLAKTAEEPESAVSEPIYPTQTTERQPSATSVTNSSIALGTNENPIIWALVPSGEMEGILTGFMTIAEIIYGETGLVVEPFVATEYAGVVLALSQDPPAAHMSTLSTFPYILAAERGVAEAELVAVRYGSPSYMGQVFVRADSGINSIADLAGKTFCRPDPLSTSGWIIPSITLLAQNIDPEKDLAEVIDAGSHEAAVADVYRGVCDAGSSYVDARSSVATEYPDIMEAIQVIEVSVDIPNDGVQYHPSVPREIRDQINGVLLSIHEDADGLEAIMAAYEWTELTATDDIFYDPFRRLLEAAGVDVETYVMP